MKLTLVRVVVSQAHRDLCVRATQVEVVSATRVRLLVAVRREVDASTYDERCYDDEALLVELLTGCLAQLVLATPA